VKQLSNTVKLRLLVEYLFLILPIAVYCAIEAIVHGSISYFFRSPEWSVGTIFSVIQTTRIHIDQFSEGHDKTFTALLLMLLGIIALSAGINIYIGLENIEFQTFLTRITKWSLFFISTLLFVIFAGAGIYEEEKESKQ
jgi:hypothetical protein